MQQVRNLKGKLVCQVDKSQKKVEIVHKGYITTICFYDDGRVVVLNDTIKS